jgi:DNA-binding LytR/AlgR family response regulator
LATIVDDEPLAIERLERLCHRSSRLEVIATAASGDDSYLFHGTPTGFEKRLDPADFMRLHRSELVRRDAVVGLAHNGGGTWVARLRNGSVLRIGRGYLETARQALAVLGCGD